MDDPLPKHAVAERRGFRFRLRTLLIAMPLLGLALGWAGVKVMAWLGHPSSLGAITVNVTNGSTPVDGTLVLLTNRDAGVFLAGQTDRRGRVRIELVRSEFARGEYKVMIVQPDRSPPLPYQVCFPRLDGPSFDVTPKMLHAGAKINVDLAQQKASASFTPPVSANAKPQRGDRQ